MKRIIAFLLLLLSFGARAEVKLPKLVSDGMVLQRDEPIKLWGWASPKEMVTVDFKDETIKTVANKQGGWELIVSAQKAGGPYEMTIKGKNEIKLKDILIGDVWLTSGQSNMELPIRRVTDLYADEIKQINNKQIRLFRSSTRKDYIVAQSDYPDGKWLPATQDNIGEFSAISWFFAQYVNVAHHVPVGIISTAIGGSPAESWLSANEVEPYLNEWKAKDEKRKQELAKIEKENPELLKFNWYKELDKKDVGAGKWSKANVDVSDWREVALPGFFRDKGIDFSTGTMWFHKEFYLDKDQLEDAVLRLGVIVNSDSAFVNGHFVGNITYQYPPRIYDVPKNVLKEGRNEVMVRVYKNGWNGGFVPEKPYELRIGSKCIDLTGTWKWHEGAELAQAKLPSGSGFMPGGLYNGLINPMKNYSIKGVLWYQGESNGGRGKEYEALFKSLILDWREELASADLPFLYVQLANLGVPNKQPVENGWADLRESQRRTLALSNTGMAVAFDIGEWQDIHPLNKKEAARRLYLEAERVAYGNIELVSAGPLYKSMRIEGESIYIKFSSVGAGLYINSRLEGFQIAGEDGVFKWAQAVVVSNDELRIWSSSEKKPIVVRYAWDGTPEGANLMNKEMLPASPFTTSKE
ncbi:MAG: sialate O-acetylesterase [Bacteroidales bacterium]